MNSATHSTKAYLPTSEFYTKTFSDREIASNSIGSEIEAPMIRKLLTNNSQESYTMVDKNKHNTNKACLINSAGKIPENAANQTIKSKQNSQFFGQRRTKNAKYKNEFIRNQKNLQANGQNLGKIMKLNQAVDDHKSETRKYGYNLIDSDQIRSNKYGDGSGYNKLTNTAFRGVKTQKGNSREYDDNNLRTESGCSVHSTIASSVSVRYCPRFELLYVVIIYTNSKVCI